MAGRPRTTEGERVSLSAPNDEARTAHGGSAGGTAGVESEPRQLAHGWRLANVLRRKVERRRTGRSRLEVEQAREQAHRADPVDQCVVDLRHDGGAAVPQVLDDVEFPERPRPIEGRRTDAGRQGGQLDDPSRSVQLGRNHVNVHIDVGVGPPRHQAQRAAVDHLVEGLDGIEACSNQATHAFDRERLGCRGGIDHQHPADVPERGRGLREEETRIETRDELAQGSTGG